MKRQLILLTTYILALWASLAYAQDPVHVDLWDGYTVTAPQGNGTAASPYLIENGANLKWVQQNSSSWGKYFLQTKDIDLGGFPLGMIGYGDRLNVGKNAGHIPFTGVYDGNGLAIHNLVLDVDIQSVPYSGKNDDISFGLFGYVQGATIRNLILDHVTMKCSNVSIADDLRIGCLVGTLSPQNNKTTKIQNIAVINSVLSDNGSDPQPRSLFVGGIIGDIANIFGGYDVMRPANSNIELRNLYADVIISFPVTTRKNVSDNQTIQFNIGGILGRVRRGNYEQLPLNTFYTGSIEAPLATISPLWGNLRVNGVNTTYLDHVKAYAGEVIKSKTSTASSADNIVVLDGPTVRVFDIDRNVDENRYYSDYKIFDSHSNTYTSFTDTDPESNPGERYGIRTLVPTSEAPATMSKTDANNPIFWSPLQGVNHGTYLKPENIVQTLGDMYGQYVSGNSELCQWVFDGDKKPYFSARPGFEMDRIGFNRFQGRLTRGIITDYKVRWSALPYESSDEQILGVTDFDASTGICQFSVPTYLEKYRYVKATLIASDGSRLDDNTGIERKYDIDISNYVELYRNGMLSFQSRISHQWLDSHWNEDELNGIKYKFQWYLADENGNSIGAPIRTSPTAGVSDNYEFNTISELPHYIKIVLCDSEGQRLPLDGNEAVTIPVTFAQESALDSYTLSMTKQTSGRNSWIVATLYDQDGNTMAGGRTPSIYEPNITFKWEVNPDPSNIRGWEEVNASDPHSSSLLAYASTVYYRVTWRYEGHDQGYEIYGDSKLIFLYDKADTEFGRTKGYTTFDGLDHWSVDGIEYTTEFPDGDDSNDGSNPYNAVHTLERAYQLCNQGRSMYDNTIVVMGYYSGGSTRLYDITAQEGLYAKPASILGAYGKNINDGTIKIYGDDDINNAAIQASTRFRDITIRGHESDKDTERHLTFYAQLHDLYFDENVIFKNYTPFKAGYGLGSTSSNNSPYITIVGGLHCPNIAEITYPEDNEEPGVTTLTFKSGAYGRIIGCSRNTGSVITLSNNTFGTPWTPCRTKVVVDIQNPTRSQCQTSSNKKIVNDIGLLVGGQTDGNVYAEVELTVKSGIIDRFIAGNISYGRVTSADTPDDSYFGSTTLTLEGGEINELYGGSLGRKGDTTYADEPCHAYFYGRSIINIEGATIHSNLYGAGAGGVGGVGDDVNHTLDPWIPYMVEYIDGSLGVNYGDYQRSKGNIPTIEMRDGTILDLNHTYSEINVYRGHVIGNIYGGGYGYSNELSGANSKNALIQAGNFYGDTKIYISQRPYSETLVEGNIYGGGAGSSYYYTYFTKTAKDPVRAELYKNTACVFGDTQVTIDGGTVTGDVFAGAQGLLGFPDIAGVYGSTFLEIKGEANVLGNIFGGSDFGSIKKRGVAIEYGVPTDPDYYKDCGGSTKVHISQTPIIGNNIFGGCNGQPNMGYRITIADSTLIHIEDGSFIDTPWTDDTQTKYRTFNIYGSGYNNCEVQGNTRVYVQRSLLQNSSSIGVDFKKYWSDLSHRRFCLYGGGYGEDTDVLGTAIVDVNINNNDVLVDPDDGIDFYRGKEIFDVSGGGYSGDVESTQVTINGNAFIRKVIGGGFFGSVRNTTNVHLISGIIFSAFGGCMMGYVHESAHLTVGTRTKDGSSAPENSTLWILDNIYGGNDVQGIVGAVPSENTSVVYPELIDPTSPEYSPYDPRVLYQSDINPESGRGAFLNVYGGHIFGSVYGAGNGHYRGYYVPGWGQYLEGADRYFRNVPSRPDINTPARVYKTRPNVGQVHMNIIGNNADDYVQIDNKVFGGGRDCTVGRWIPEMMPGDPRRLDLKGGGYLNMNFGSNVRVEKSVYLGSQGASIGVQPTLKGIDPADLELAMTLDAQTQYQELHDVVDRLGEAAYYHWYYDSDAETYKIGFAPKGKMYLNPADPDRTGMNPYDDQRSYFLVGGHQFFGYCKFMETAAKINLTFYDEDFKNGNFKKMPEDPDLCISGPTGVRYDSENIRFGSFFLGGEHGFMTYQPQEYIDENGEVVTDGSTDYSYDIMLPPGLTITEKVVGGSEDSWIKYYGYTDESCTELDIASGPVYQTGSGIGVEPSFATDPYPMCQYPEIDENYEAVITPGEPMTTNAIRLSVVCDFDPQLGEDALDPVTGQVDKFRRYGGLIYGGCYKSGITSGNVVLNIGANLVGRRNESFYCADTLSVNQKYASLEYNVGRVFGGGYGKDTHVLGDTYVYLLNDFKGMNVFGGSCLGNVMGQTNVSYLGNSRSYVYGSIYGGSLQGNVGYRTVLENGTTVADGEKVGSRVALYSGNVAFVYGGSCMGDVYGGTSVDVSNGHLDRQNRLEHINWDMIETADWGTARVVAGRVFGGNDISGRIIERVDPFTLEPYDEPLTHVDVSELTEPVFGTEPTGKDYTYTGFPLVGYLYGGSNANYGTHNDVTQKYTSGTMVLATGTMTETHTIDLTGNDIPNVKRAQIDILGGTVLNAFGGGNKSTIENRVDIQVAYVDTVARATISNVAEPGKAMRLWNMLQMPNADQQDEVSRVNNNLHTTFKYQVFNLFGGNDNADMAIQPRWNLCKGMIGNVFSGGNVGGMTYYNPTPDPTSDDEYLHNRGLTIAVDSRDIYIGSIYGGGRIGDIRATDSEGNPVTFTGEDDYGATVHIRRGFIDHVYGGNDVAGQVHNGTRVNIRGAVSGDIYGAGNGNYIYKYDTSGKYTSITEAFTKEGKRYFLLPRKDQYATRDASGDILLDGSGNYADVLPENVILAINSYRPNVDRTFIDIQGTESDKVWVRGSVFCGGNSSTILAKKSSGSGSASSTKSDIKFNIGSYVNLSRVFLGANGRDLVVGQNIYQTEQMNSLDFTQENTLTPASVSNLPQEDQGVDDLGLYPRLFDLYMRAVAVHNLPNDFAFRDDLVKTYIGEFYVGGNHGSMLTDEKVTITFPEQLVIYNHIVGGCNQATVNYKNVTHVGGLNKKTLAADNDKLHLIVKSIFSPMLIDYPQDKFASPVEVGQDLVDRRGNSLYTLQSDGTYAFNGGNLPAKEIYYPQGKCNVYGGCFTSGTTVGNILIDVFSDMIDYSFLQSELDRGRQEWQDGVIRKASVVNAIDDLNWRSFHIVGGGFGYDTEVQGNTTVRMLPGPASKTYTEDLSPRHPSVGGVFGGSMIGHVIGNSRVEVRDGYVLTDVYGASESAILHGSSNVTVGYPTYYTAKTTGEYTVKRLDDISLISQQSQDATNPKKNHDDSEIIRRTFNVIPGDIVPLNVYEAIEQEKGTDRFSRVEDHPRMFGAESHLNPAKWDDIEINIGDQFSMHHKDAPFFSHGNIYGGGYNAVVAHMTLVGQNTVVDFDADNNVGTASIGHGGNTSVMIWDNPENADLSLDLDTGTTSDGSQLKDHISVSTGIFHKVTLKKGQDKMGYYKFDETQQIKFVHQPTGSVTAEEAANDVFFEFVGDGGVYGGGRTVYAKGFRSIDIANYGYAGYAPQQAKQLNTFQRADMLTVRDCCLMLQGANDFATNLVDNTSYSINRVGELNMVSSIPLTSTLVDDGRDSNFFGNTLHTTRRSRNYLAFYRTVHFLGAYSSDVPFDTDRHDETGTITTNTSYMKSKHDIIDQYYQDKATYAKDFEKRNQGTSRNMIGINNGYALRIQGNYTEQDPTSTSSENYFEKYYYGPIFGVTEIKLLTLAVGEGGGYIYALNHHYDSEYDGKSTALKDIYKDTAGDKGILPQDFMHTTGNFVFPGAAFLSDGGEDYNYIIDDCIPIGTGYDHYHQIYTEAHPSARSTDGFDVNDYISDPAYGTEGHYWYVNGQRFTFNVTLTAYTKDTEDTPENFYLQNDDLLVTLPNLGSNMNLRVNSIQWHRHPEKEETREDYDCDLLVEKLAGENVYKDKDYNLFLTVDRNPYLATSSDEHAYDHAFFVELPRHDFYADGSSTDPSILSSDSHYLNPNDPTTQRNYNEIVEDLANSTTYSAEGNNVAAVGIRLRDAVHNRFADQDVSVGREYWQKHLSDSHKVRIELKADKDGVTYTYLINLKIDYLLGPSIQGTPVIENCALPGEYIYINSDDVVVDMDGTNMAITERNWYILPVDENGNEKEDKMVQVNEYKYKGDRIVRLPAFYYQNGWKVWYVVKANGQNLKVRVENTEEHPAAHPALEIHNYHRMDAYDGSYRHNLRLTPGARIYIEDQRDFQRFLQYLDSVQYDNTHVIPDIELAHTDGHIIHPRFAEGLDFYLQSNVVVPESLNPEHSQLVFKGNFHGNGFHINIGEHTTLPLVNAGNVYNTGFISVNDNDQTCVFNKNSYEDTKGHIENCYYFNDKGKGWLAQEGDLVNCYQNTSVQPEFSSTHPNGGLLQLSTNAFCYGQVAYNLNGFYLKKRDLLLRRTGAINSHAYLENADTDFKDEEKVEYIEKMFNNGDYQYAFYDPKGHFKEGLRTFDIPNYFDMMGLHEKNQVPTHHDVEHPDDELRPLGVDPHPDIHHPQLAYDDYLFFGQEISAEAAQREPILDLPSQFTADTRVYRVSGFYGSKMDRGFFLNKTAYIGSPIVTAIDFTGIRDKDPRIIANINTLRSGSDWNGWLMKEPDGTDYTLGLQETFYPPMLDVSITEREDINDITLHVGQDVTHNLLVYGHKLSSAIKDIYQPFHYQDKGAPTSDHNRALYDNSTIIGHHIIVHDQDPDYSAHTYEVYGGFMDLVDANSFNAPTQIQYKQLWYNRKPRGYADQFNNVITDKSAWEGIYLPFTVEKVYAAAMGNNVKTDHGEITHFYDDSQILHEYWLRRPTSIKEDDGMLLGRFESPNATNEKGFDGHGHDAIAASYSYVNHYFSDAYGEFGYEPIEDFTHHDAYTGRHTFTDYRYLTAAVPYIITYPGECYREFDFSGQFYSKTLPGEVPVTPQTVCYNAHPNSKLEVTDDLENVIYKMKGYSFRGTFTHLNPSASATVLAIPEFDGATNWGQEFEPLTPGGTVIPFRVYFQKESSSSNPGSRSIMIAGPETENLQPGEEDDPLEEELTVGNERPSIKIRVEGRTLVITSTYESAFQMPIYNLQGQYLRRLPVFTGENRYEGFDPGIYLTRHAKFRISL